MMPRIHLVGNHILNRQAFKKQFNDSIVKASESIQNLYPKMIRSKGLAPFRKTMEELGAWYPGATKLCTQLCLP